VHLLEKESALPARYISRISDREIGGSWIDPRVTEYTSAWRDATTRLVCGLVWELRITLCPHTIAARVRDIAHQPPVRAYADTRVPSQSIHRRAIELISAWVSVDVVMMVT